MTRRFWSVLALLWLSSPLFAERVEQLPSPLPRTHVADPRGLLAADTRAELDRLAATLDRAGRGELGFVVIGSTGGVEPRKFATDVFNRWGIGDRQRNDGTLILLAKDDRAAEIVFGIGIDTATNRDHADRIMQGTMVPRFRDGNYDQALVAGTAGLLLQVYGVDLSRPAEQPDSAAGAAAVASEATDAPARAPAVDHAQAAADSAAPAPLATVPPAPGTATSAPAHREFDGFVAAGLAIFAAVGAAALWLLNKLMRMLWWFTGSRWFSRRCSACNTPMQQLSEVADDAYLNAGQLTEEKLGSVDHRVFLCPRCNKVDAVARRAWFTRYSDCAVCHSRAQSSVSKTITSATRYSTGLAEVTLSCQHCGNVKTEQRVLPVLPPPSTSSSSSGGSYGGGRSSGGGASGRW